MVICVGGGELKSVVVAAAPVATPMIKSTTAGPDNEAKDVSVADAASREEAWEHFEAASPFYPMKISSHAPLRDLQTQGRRPCPQCRRSILYFCYRCVWLPPGVSLPRVALPLELLVVKHWQELEGKSTAIHAKLLAPAQVTLAVFDPVRSSPLIRPFASPPADPSDHAKFVVDPVRDVVLFPDGEAAGVAQIDWTHVRRLVVIDGTWRQAKAMLQTAPLAALPKVKLDGTHQTAFWRYQSLGPHCLATIEAIHRFCQEHQRLQRAGSDAGRGGDQLDNLLYIFSYLYGLVQDEYARNPAKKYTAKHRPGYIRTVQTGTDGCGQDASTQRSQQMVHPGNRA